VPTTGVVATSDQRASHAGADVLRAGGNAIDAAVTAMLALYVLEPQSCGPGGDGFLMAVEPGGPPLALDGAGEIPLGLSAAALAADGLSAIPPRGARTATVPGALTLLSDAVARFGTISFADAARSAIAFARDGYQVGPTLAVAAARAVAEIADDPVLGPLYAPDGQAVHEGQTVRNPAIAECLATFATDGPASLRDGALAAAIVERVRAGGGYLDVDDLRRHKTLERVPDSVRFRGAEVWEFGSPTQGPAVLDALRRLEVAGPTIKDWAAVIEAVQAGMVESGFDLSTMVVGQPSPARGDTTYVAVIDSDHRAASLISSVFGDFGSHFGIPELGGPILNRASILRPFHRDPEPGTKPPHTTIPAAVTRDGALAYVLGVAGGFMQPQAQVQVLVHLLEHGLDPQAAIDEPRFKILFGGSLALEADHPLSDDLPDAAARAPGPEGYGAAQVAGIVGGELLAGADHRRHGAVVTVMS
jgi:gamma-glutamyltranspeptidase/glutathione hydrolase